MKPLLTLSKGEQEKEFLKLTNAVEKAFNK